jgi:hypothetical protein
MREPILTIFNQHSAQCGTPPPISNESHDLYIGYFENPFGEQWVFTFNRKTGEARLRGGDVGWENVHEVRDGRVPELVLGKAEIAWLQACWKAVNPRLRGVSDQGSRDNKS